MKLITLLKKLTIFNLMNKFIFTFLIFLFCKNISLSKDALDTKDFSKSIKNIALKSKDYVDIPFPLVINSITKKKIIPINDKNKVDKEIIEVVKASISKALKKMNSSNSPTNNLSRINEASRFFENFFVSDLNKLKNFECSFPLNAKGKAQRSGYPDILLKHLPSGKITYLDPKLYEKNSKKSSYRTFYYEPKFETNKVLYDAHHLIIGIGHDGNSGKWKFVEWSLLDLTKLKIKLKLEFQASNKQMYNSNLIIYSSQKEE